MSRVVGLRHALAEVIEPNVLEEAGREASRKARDKASIEFYEGLSEADRKLLDEHLSPLMDRLFIFRSAILNRESEHQRRREREREQEGTASPRRRPDPKPDEPKADEPKADEPADQVELPDL